MNQFQTPANVYEAPSILDNINIEELTGDGNDRDLFEMPNFKGHAENLAERLPEYVLSRISGDLSSAIEDDLLSRKDWEDALKEGLEQLGLKVDQREFPFNGASGVYSPIMLQTVLEYTSTAYPELFPIGGPVKQLIVGDINEEIEGKAERVEDWSNLFFTEVATEYYPDNKKMLTWNAIFGCTFKKIYFDAHFKRPTARFLRGQDLIVDYNTTDLKTSWRTTEVISINRKVLSEKLEMGIWRDINLAADDTDGDDNTNFARSVDEVEGKTNPNYDKDFEYTFYESHTYLDIKEIEKDGYENEVETSSNKVKLRPYIITMHKKTNKIMAIYRNWEEEDDTFEPKEYYVKYGYAEGLGFYDIGAAHLIGGLAQASTALLRQTIDGQTLANFPGGMYSKGMAKLEDNNIRIGPTEFIPIDTNGLPIDQVISPMPYREPSPQINVLRNELQDAAAMIMGAANKQIGDFSPQMPVGTTYALLGILHKMQGSVIRSNRDSLTRELKLFYKLFAKHLPDTPYNFDKQGGQGSIQASDFDPQIQMVPIADPHVTTETQRLLRYDILLADSRLTPGLFNPYILERNKCRSMKMSNAEIDEFLPPPEETKPLDPVSENAAIIMGKAAMAALPQDHEAHIIIHSILLNDPNTPPQVIAAAMAHIQMHKAMKMQIDMQNMIGVEIPEDPTQLSMEEQNQIAMALAQKLLEQQGQEQGEQPPAPIDPAAAVIEVAKIETQVKDKGIDEKSRTDEMKVETEAFKAQLNYEVEMEKIKLEREKLGLKAMEVAHKDIAQGLPQGIPTEVIIED